MKRIIILCLYFNMAQAYRLDLHTLEDVKKMYALNAKQWNESAPDGRLLQIDQFKKFANIITGGFFINLRFKDERIKVIRLACILSRPYVCNSILPSQFDDLADF